MRSYDEAFAAARDVPAFSNGTEGYGWMENWCEDCIHDTEEKVNRGEGCPLILVAMMQRTPSEWLDGPRDEQGRYSIEDQYHCIEFRADDDGPGEDGPKPPPEPMPGEEPLFDMRLHVRMYADAVLRPVGVEQ